ncbi:hypothetical protein PAPYR_11300 [Paratrimastix pyriformis]|uniref:Secreted protein n=1 Tax=Paratrimastix pyriformis TaxID=342808 RepID=A0ABQ8U8A3_9EUKA|nr:hypothetical protein PAPYR_11300 [Paratrimastix pyriformis]
MYLRGLHVFMPWYVHGVSSMLGALLPRCVCGLRAPRQIAYTPNGLYIDRVKGGATRCVFTLISQCDTVTLWGP